MPGQLGALYPDTVKEMHTDERKCTIAALSIDVQNRDLHDPMRPGDVDEGHDRMLPSPVLCIVYNSIQ
jgi:hypothetical protein